MDKNYILLQELCHKKESDVKLKKIPKIIKQQLIALNKLLEKEYLEEKYVEHILEKTKNEELYKEYTTSIKKHNQLIKEKNSEEHFKQIFTEEIKQFHQKLSELKIILEKQLAHYTPELLDEEKSHYNKLGGEFQKINLSEKNIVDYFKDINKLRYKHGWMKKGRFFSKILNGVSFKIEVEGLENIPKSGPCILAPHHVHANYDATILMAIINRHLFFLTSVEGFIALPFADTLFHNLGCLPFKRNDENFNSRKKNAISKERVDNYPLRNIDSLKKLLVHLRYGDIIVLFPEAEAKINSTYVRPNNEDFLPPQEGFVELAVLARRKYGVDIPIIPIGFNYSKNFWGKVKVRIGKPNYLIEYNQNMSKEKVKQLIWLYTDHIFAEIKELSK